MLVQTARTVARGRELLPALELSAALLTPTAACPPSAATCSGLDLAPCVRSLVGLYDALRAAPPQPSPGRTVAADLLAEDVGAAIVRMQEAARAVARGRCDMQSDPGEWAARAQLGPSPDRLVVEPILPLPAGRRHALVIDGLSPVDREHARATAVPRVEGARLAVPAGAFVTPVLARQASLGVLDRARTTALMERLERAARELPAWPAIAGVAVTLTAPVTGERLAALRPRYVGADTVPAAETVVAFEVLDVRAGLAAYRAALAAIPCRAEPGTAVNDDPMLAGPFPHVDAVLRLRVESLVLGVDDDVPATLGADPDPSRSVSRPLLVAVPRDVAPDAPAVLLVGGYEQPAAVMLATHAEGVAARGMIALALELPHQGALADGGDLLPLLDPAAVARNLRQAAVDALAVLDAVRRCGVPLADGRRVRPVETRYAGYSIGAMVGTLVRAVDPELGATVLFAPGADHAEWSGIRVAQALGSPLVSCIGGADDGRTCFERRTCAPPGVCGPDPAMHALGTAMRLPYTLASAGAEPAAFAGPAASDAAPLLLLSGGADIVIPPVLAGRLADAYGLVATGPGRRAAGTTVLLEAPTLGHELSTVDSVRERAYTFLASGGAQAPETP